MLADVRESDEFLPSGPGAAASQYFDDELVRKVVGRSSGVEGRTEADDGP